jgi:hypothetical protein
MKDIISFKGKVKFPITIDPSVWIFDDRRIDLSAYFEKEHVQIDEEEEYKKSISKHWDREIREGAVFPPTLKTERKFEKEKVLTGTFGMPLAPFIQNAEPDESANTLVIETDQDEFSFSIEKAKEFILQFSINGKPLREDGPVYVIFGDGSNRDNPIKNVNAFRIE